MNDLTNVDDRTLDAVLAVTLFGYRFWTERRGGYTYFVSRAAGEREPWASFRNAEAERERYAEAAFADYDPREHVTGGDLFPRYAYDPAAALAVAEAMGALQPSPFVAEWMRYPADPEPPGRHAAVFWPQFMEGPAALHWRRASTFPRAVAEAAVFALENAGLLPDEALALLPLPGNSSPPPLKPAPPR